MITGGSEEDLLFPKALTLALGSTQPPLQRVLGTLLTGVKLTAYKADCLPLSSAKFKNMRCYTSTAI
jgi:hypothetical protein